jgi:transporter family protein
MTTAATWVYWALLSAVFAALTAIFAKVGVQGVSPDLATLIRTLVIAAVVFGFVQYTGQWTNPLALPVKTWASWICYFRALQLGDVSKVAPVDKLSLVLIAVFALLFLGERPSARDWTGILLVGTGVLIIAAKR